MPVETELRRLAAFTLDPAGGNPAGVWIGADLPDPAEMQRIAAEVGYSETAFLAPDGTHRPGAYRVRYFSPAAEVPFCGHATIASGVALAERTGPGRLLPGDQRRPRDGRHGACAGWTPAGDPRRRCVPGCATPSPTLWRARLARSAGVRGARPGAAAGGRLTPAPPISSWPWRRTRPCGRWPTTSSGSARLMLAAALTTRPARLARGPRPLPGARPVPGRRRRRGSRDRRGRRRTRCVPALARRARAACPVHDQPGRRDGPAEPDRGRDPRPPPARSASPGRPCPWTRRPASARRRPRRGIARTAKS